VRLLSRVSRLEQEIKPTETCPTCSRTYIWGIPDDRIGDPTWRPVCDVCGKSPEYGYVKLIAQSLLDML
jgi:ribosomal protein L37AE/L43A